MSTERELMEARQRLARADAELFVLRQMRDRVAALLAKLQAPAPPAAAVGRSEVRA